MKDLRRWTKTNDTKDLTRGKRWVDRKAQELIDEAAFRQGLPSCTLSDIINSLAAGKAAVRELDRLDNKGKGKRYGT